LHVEVISPRQSLKKAREKLKHSTSHGCALGWLIDPDEETIYVDRPGRRAVRTRSDGVLEGEPVLPGFRLPVAQVFRWLELDL
jgi:Uma2 family endonuclease